VLRLPSDLGTVYGNAGSDTFPPLVRYLSTSMRRPPPFITGAGLTTTPIQGCLVYLLRRTGRADSPAMERANAALVPR